MPRFVVQEHHASRLHYDFRLEHAWSIMVDLSHGPYPRKGGPSMDPAHKRLAILVEDHELGYADFEGTIEEGGYGAGEVRIWDSGKYESLSGGPDEGKWEFSLDGQRLKGAFIIFCMKARMKDSGTEWLLLKKKDGLELPGFKLEAVISQ